jgi:beta-mannosidase
MPTSDPRILPLDGDDWTAYWLLPSEWEWRRVWEKAPPEAASRVVPAVVPGHAQDAVLLSDDSLPHPYAALTSHDWEWICQRDWVFEKRFTLPAEPPAGVAHSALWLRFEGIDDAAHVYLNGAHVGDHEGQFVPAEWEVAHLARPGEENHLLVVVERAPDVQGQIGRTSRERRWKSRFAYGWDWCTRLVPVGVWGSVSLTYGGPARFRSVSVHTNLSIERTEASVAVVTEFAAVEQLQARIVTEISQAGLPVETTDDGVHIFPSDTSIVQSFEIPHVQLWQPNGSGRAALYDARVSLVDEAGRLLDRREFQLGVRQVEALPCEGAPPDSLPYLLSVNGRKTWIKGWNWVPLDHLYGAVPEERYAHFLRLAKEAGVNLLRVWGGGLLERDVFYRLCDRFGIMVWQEFPLSSSGLDNTPPSDPAYLRYIRAQADRMLQLRKTHPSLVLWCGGNELTDAASAPLGSDHPALAELRRAVEMEDPDRLWLPTSPTGPHFSAEPKHRGEIHDGHGPWLWLGLREHPRFYNDIDPLLHSEFGCEGAANPETLEFIFEEDEAPPPDREDPVWMHHGGDWWLRPEKLQEAFGALLDALSFVWASQLLQAAGLQYAVEANRRRKWRCAGTLPWQFNEAWPNAVCTNAVDYFGRPKPAYYAVKRAYRPFHVSAAFDTFSWAGEAAFRADVWLHNSGEERSLLNVVASIVDLEGRELYQENLAGEAPENAAENVGDLSWRFPEGFESAFALCLEVIDENGDSLACNAYLHSRAPDPPFGPLLTAPATKLTVLKYDGGIEIRNAGSVLAVGVQVSAGYDIIEDSDFPLAPGAARRVAVEGADEIWVSAWNAPSTEAA